MNTNDVFADLDACVAPVLTVQEARDDIAFARFHKDPDFVKLTAGADGMGAMKRSRG